METLSLVLNHNFAQLNHLCQERGLSHPEQCRYDSRHLLVTSVWPSVSMGNINFT